MEEIKLRGNKSQTKDWIYGNLTYHPKGSFACISQIVNNPVSNGIIKGWCFGVDSKSLGQYSGLKDVNGKEIYEGDLLQSKTKYAIMNFRVMRKKGGLVINSHSNDFKRKEAEIIFTDALADMQTASFIENSCVVIGNVFDNEDLLL